jgi:putative heme-binding domain-containing protein
MLGKVANGRSYEKAKTALVSTQCVFCHRVSADNTLPAGIVGPDLTQVSARFGRRDMLMHILEPSVVIEEKFRSTIVTKVDGQQIIGTLESEDDERVVLKPNALSPGVIEIGKSMIQKRTISEVSPMPLGLLNALKVEQILDLLAWFEVGGDAKAKVWGKE